MAKLLKLPKCRHKHNRTKKVQKCKAVIMTFDESNKSEKTRRKLWMCM